MEIWEYGALMPGVHQIVIYDHPADFPDHWIARAWKVVDVGGEPQPMGCWGCKKLEDLRQFIDPRFILMPRDPNDDPKIFEVWI